MLIGAAELRRADEPRVVGDGKGAAVALWRKSSRRFHRVTRISEMCELAGAMLMPHSYASAISDFANIHVQVASMQVPLIEFRTLEPVTSILRRELVSPAMPKIADGWIAAPTTRGSVSNSTRNWSSGSG